MRAMLDMDIPLNAGCLVPLTSTVIVTFPGLFADLVRSQHPWGNSSVPFPNCCGLRWQRVNITTHCGCSAQSLPRVCRKSRLHKVRPAGSIPFAER